MSEQSSAEESLYVMEEWLKIHPVEIPEEIVACRAEWNRKMNDPLLSREDWTKIIHEIKKTKEALSGTEDGKYHRLAQLREAPTMPGAQSEIYLLERELSDCFCSSGKKFKECHGK